MDYVLAENAVLSSAMRDETGRASATMLEHLIEDDFSSPDRQRMFQVIKKLAPDCNEVDVMMELPELASMITEVSQLYGGGSINRYVDHLIEHRNHRAVELALLHAKDASNEGKGAEEIASKFTNQVAQALTKRKGQVGMKTAVNEAHAKILEMDAGGSSAISTGFSKLDDNLMGGFQDGWLYTIAARPGVGKSALAIHFATQAARSGIRCSYCSLEMSAGQLAGRLLTSVSGVPRPKGKGSLTHEQKTKLERTTQALKGWPITFKDDTESTIESFAGFVAQERLLGDLGLIIVDYLQLLSSPGHDSRQQEVSHITRQLKSMALTYQVPVLALSQLNRALESQNRDPALSDLRESGSIEQDSDAVILLNVKERLEDFNDVIKLNLAKARDCETGVLDLLFSKRTGKFSSYHAPRLNDNEKPKPKSGWMG